MPIRYVVRLAGAFAASVLAGAVLGQQSGTTVNAVLEARGRQFFYAGDPVPLEISIGNDADAAVANPVSSGLLQGFEVRTADGALVRPTGSAGVPEPSRPATLAAKSGYSVVVDMTRIYPELLRAGGYSVRWAADGIAAGPIVVHTIPRFDPGREYVARVETDEGTFTIGFFPRTAPVAVKSFIDLCNAGFYEGLAFHKVLPDYYVEGGDGSGDGNGRPPFTYPSELANIPAVAGTVLLKPVSPSPPSNGSQFLILLRPESSWTGQATVLGHVIDGLEVVKQISRVSSSGQVQKPYFRPLAAARIRRITIQERAAAPAGAAS